MQQIKYLLILAIILITRVFSEPTAKQTYMVSMRDGIKLATDVYRPMDLAPHPVLLYRTRYNKNNSALAGVIPLLNLKGYICVIQDTRGRYASQGVDSLFITDGWGALRDGYDTIEWLSKQSWCNGKIGMLGASADGIITYRTAAALHPALKCAVAIVAATDLFHQVVYPGGEYRKEICENYLTEQNAGWLIPFYLQNPYYNEIWQAMNWHTRSDSIRIPMLHIGGWYDCFSDGTVAAFQALHQQSYIAPQQLLMGPWTHATIGSESSVGEMRYPSAGYDIYTHIIQWFDYWLFGRDTGIGHSAAVRYYLMGDPDMKDEEGCVWKTANTWPPVEMRTLPLYLSQGGLLRMQTGEDGQISFLYDPEQPVPTRGGNNLTIAAGPYDQTDLLIREDVVTFSTDILQQPLRVEGVVKAHLFVSSDAPDTDFSFKLIDVYPDGRHMLVTDGIQRMRFRNGSTPEKEVFLQPGEIVGVTISLPPTAIVFNSGHRLMVAFSSSNYNRFEVNPNTASAVNDRSEPRKAMQTIHYGSSYASHVRLPVVASGASHVVSLPMPRDFAISTAYPNPFNQITRIDYFLPQPQWVQIHISNVCGQRVRTLYQGFQAIGQHQAIWDGADQGGRPVPGGVYYFSVQTHIGQKWSKVCLLR